MLDKSLPFYDIVMKRAAGTPVPPLSIPEGFTIRTYRQGDARHWADNETSVGEFSHIEAASDRFARDFLPWEEVLYERSLFAVSPYGIPVGNLTVWWDNPVERRLPWIHWLAVRPDFQGLGIGSALVASGLQLAVRLEGDVDIYLKTQTWSWPAVRIYLAAGFEITDEPNIGGFANTDSDLARSVLKEKLTLP